MKKIIYILMLVILSSLVLASSPYPDTNPYGAARIFHFNANSGTTVTDSLGVGNGVAVNIEDIDWIVGQTNFSNALQLDTLDEYANSSYGLGDLYIGGGFTVCYWLKTSQNNFQRYFVYSRNETTKFTMASWDASTTYHEVFDHAGGKFSFYADGNAYDTNSWQHYCLVKYGSLTRQTYDVYVNGTNTTRTINDNGDLSENSSIGYILLNGNNFGGGVYDDLIIFPYALNGGDINTIFEGNYSGGAGSPTNKLDNCSTNTNQVLNFTVIDQDGAAISGYQFEALFTYWRNPNTSSTSYFSFDENHSISNAICASSILANDTINAQTKFSKYGYGSVNYYESSYELSASAKDVTIVLSNTNLTSSISVLLINEYSYALPNYIVEAYKYDLGTNTYSLVDIETTNSLGYAPFYLDITVDEYKFVIKYSNGTTIYTEPKQKITTSPVIIQITTQQVTLPYSTGVVYDFNPDIALINNTEYGFDFTVNSSYWTITACSFKIKNSTYTFKEVIGTYDSDSCYANITLNTFLNATFTAEGNYSLNGTIQLQSRGYNIIQFEEGEFSFKNFLDDLTNFTSAGFNSFSRMIIAMIIIIALTVWVGSLVAFKEAEPMLLVVFLLTLFFCYLGWFRVEGMISDTMIGAAFMQKYLIAVMTGLICGAIWIRRMTE